MEKIAQGRTFYECLGVLWMIVWSSIGPCLGSVDFWMQRNPVPTGNLLARVSVSNGLWVAIGSHGTIVTSHDAKVWIRQKSGTQELLRGIAVGNGKIVVVGMNGTILFSEDGMQWRNVDVDQ